MNIRIALLLLSLRVSRRIYVFISCFRNSRLWYIIIIIVMYYPCYCSLSLSLPLKHTHTRTSWRARITDTPSIHRKLCVSWLERMQSVCHRISCICESHQCAQMTCFFLFNVNPNLNKGDRKWAGKKRSEVELSLGACSDSERLYISAMKAELFISPWIPCCCWKPAAEKRKEHKQIARRGY